jgi:hypothetical protein
MTVAAPLILDARPPGALQKKCLDESNAPARKLLLLKLGKNIRKKK